MGPDSCLPSPGVVVTFEPVFSEPEGRGKMDHGISDDYALAKGTATSVSIDCIAYQGQCQQCGPHFSHHFYAVRGHAGLYTWSKINGGFASFTGWLSHVHWLHQPTISAIVPAYDLNTKTTTLSLPVGGQTQEAC